MKTKEIARKVVKHVKENYIPPLQQAELFITHDCNFCCDYCFVGEKRHYHMTEEIAIKGINLLFRESRNSQEVGIVFFGGEPLMNINVLKAAVQHARDMGKFYRKQVHFGVTTNGSLLSEDMCEYLKEVHINPLISIDGSEHIHNSHRKYADGSDTFKDVICGLRNAVKTHGFVGVRITVSPENVSSLYNDIVWLYQTVNISSFTICYNTAVNWTNDEINRYLLEMKRLNDLFLSEQKQGRSFSLRENTSTANYIDRGKDSRPCSAATTAVAISPEGKLYPCSRFVRGGNYCIGTVDEGRVLNKELKEILVYRKKAKSNCDSCAIENFCVGGCIAINLEQTCDIEKKADRDCKIQAGLYSILLENVELLRVSRPNPISGIQNTCIY